MSVQSNNSDSVRSLEFNFSSLSVQHSSQGKSSSPTSCPAYSHVGNGGIWRVMPLPETNKIVSASYDRLAKLWTTKRVDEGIEFADVKLLKGHKKEVLCLTQVNNETFATGSADSIMQFWKSCDGTSLGSLYDRAIKTGFYSMSAIDENTVATGSCHMPRNHRGHWQPVIKFWDINKKKFLYSLKGHSGGISSLVQLNKQIIASGSGDATVRIWDIAKKAGVSIFKNHTDYVYSLAKVDAGRIISAGKDRSIRILDVQAETQLGTLKDGQGVAHASTIYDVDTYEGKTVVSSSRDGYVKLWDLRTMKVINILDPADGFVYSAKFSQAGNIVAGTSGKLNKQSTKKNTGMQKKELNAHVIVWDIRKVEK